MAANIDTAFHAAFGKQKKTLGATTYVPATSHVVCVLVSEKAPWDLDRP